MIDSMLTLFARDLDHLSKELSTYQDESKIWKTDKEINNSAGTLCLHLCGNLKHFIGALLGNSGYIREREKEFTTTLSRKELLLEIESTKKVTLTTLRQIKLSTLKQDYPINVFGKQMTVEFFIIHLHGHLTYHLGQITYHRRLLDSN